MDNFMGQKIDERPHPKLLVVINLHPFVLTVLRSFVVSIVYP